MEDEIDAPGDAALAIVETVADVAAEIIEEHDAAAETAGAVNDALIAANLESVEEHRRQEFADAIRAEISRTNERVSQCETDLSTTAARSMEMAETLAAALATLSEMSSILQALSLQSAVEDGPRESQESENQEPQEAPTAPEPSSEPAPLPNPALKRKTRLI